MSVAVIPIERAGVRLLQQLVAEAAQGLRNGWTLDATFEGDAEERLRSARRRAHLLAMFGHEARVLDEPEVEAAYVWRRA